MLDNDDFEVETELELAMEEVNTYEKDWAEALQVVEFLYAQNQELLTQAA